MREMRPGDADLEAALEAKANLSPGEAHALDWQAYNEQKLVIMRCKDLHHYEHRNFWTSTMYQCKCVFATEVGDDKVSSPSNKIEQWLRAKFFARVDVIGVFPLGGYVVSDGYGGARLPELAFFPDALTNRPGLEGCNTRNEPWPGGVITIGVARTLPELIQDSKFYFTDPKSCVNFYLGVKVYALTQQMVAFLRVRAIEGGTQLAWAVSFGPIPIGPSSIAALLKEGVAEVLGLNVPCTEPGIDVFKVVLNKAWFFPGFPRGSEQCMENDVELDLFDVQQWCLGGLEGDVFRGASITQEEAGQVQAGTKNMVAAAWAGTGIWYAKIPAEKRLAEQVARQVAAQLRGSSQGAGSSSGSSSMAGPPSAPVGRSSVKETPEQILERVARSQKQYERAFRKEYRKALAASAGGAPAASAGPSRSTRSKTKKGRHE